MNLRQRFNTIRKGVFSILFSSKRRLIIMILILVVGLGGYKLLTKSAEGITTTQVTRQTLKQTLSANGKIQAHNYADLKFNLPGKVVWVGVKEGDQVRAWQGVASLDKRLLQKDLETALSQYMTSRWDFNDMHLETYKDQVITDVIKRALDRSQFSMDRTVLNVEMKDIALKEAVLVSPISGIVVETNDLKAGVNLSAGDLGTKTVRVVDLSSWYFRADVDEVDFSKVKVDQEVEVNLDAYPDKSCSGKVVMVGRQGEETSGGVVTIPVEVNLIDCDWDLAMNLNGEAGFVLSKMENALVIPKKYLVEKDGGTQVWVQIGKTVKQRELKDVEAGATTSTDMEIVSGLGEGDTVVFVPGG